MPAAFNKCRAGGGKIRTKRVSRTHYMRICIPKGGGSSVAGETHRYVSLTKRSLTKREKKNESSISI